MVPLLWALLLGYVSVGKTLLVILEPNSRKEVHVPGILSAHFTIETCAYAGMVFRLGSDSAPNYKILINYEFEGNVYTLIGYQQHANETTANVKESTLGSYPICSSHGNFWVSWGNGSLTFGEGSIVDSSEKLKVAFDAQVDSFTVTSSTEKAIWNFPELAETTSVTSLNNLDTGSTSNGQGFQSSNGTTAEDFSSEDPDKLQEQEPETDRSKSSAPGSTMPVKMFGFVTVCWFAAVQIS